MIRAGLLKIAARLHNIWFNILYDRSYKWIFYFNI